MAISERAGRPGRPLDAGRRRSARALVLRDPARPGRSRAARRVRDVGASRLVAQRRVQRGPHRGHDRGDLPLPREPGHGRPAVHRARTRTPCPSRRSGPRSRSSSRTTSTSASMPPTATRRPRSSRTRSSSTTAAAATTWPTASSSRRRTTRPRTAASSTTRPTAARPTPTSPAGSRTRRTGCSRPDLDGVRRVPIADARAADDRPRLRRRPTSTISPRSSTWTPSAASGLRLGVDPLGGASVAYWPAIARPLRPRPDGHQRRRRPAVRVHDLRLGRPDPDGPVVAVRDGPAGRAARPVRCRVRQRHRRRPARDRHAGRRADEPEPLPVRGGRATCSAAGATGARTSPSARRSCRARCSIASPPTWGAACSRCRSGSSGSSRASRRQPRVRRRGECRGLVPAPRRHGLDDRQGRHHRLPAGGRDDRADAAATRVRRIASLTERFGAPVYRRIDAPATPAQKAVLARLSPEQVPATELAGEPVTGDPDHGARQRGGDRRGQGHDRARLVRGPAVRHGERLQDLRRELPRRGPSRTHHRGGTGRRREGPGMTDEHEHDHGHGDEGHDHDHEHDHEHEEHDHDFDYVGAVEDERARKDDWFRSSSVEPAPARGPSRLRRASPTSRSIRRSGSRTSRSSRTPATSRPPSRSRPRTGSSDRPIGQGRSPSSSTARRAG